jgi:hypothetical protein
MARGTICRSYLEMVDAFNSRAVEINATRLDIDEKSGLASGHSSKLLCPKPIKGFGQLSFDLVMQTLGLRIVVQVDPDRPPLAGNSRKLRPRNPEAVLRARRRARGEDVPEPAAPPPSPKPAVDRAAQRELCARRFYGDPAV